MRFAIVYDRVNKWGGAERVLLALHEMFPNAPLYTSVYNPKTAPWAKVFPKVIPSFVQKFPLAKTRHDLYAPLMPLAFEPFDFSEYDVVISVTSEAAKGIITKPGTLHICYMLTPTRYLWSGYKEYFNSSFKRTIAKPVIGYLKWWDKAVVYRPDVMVGISKTVVERIKKYYNRDALLIYPPVDLKIPETYGVSKGDYFLVVSRLVPYKRINLVIEVFNQLKWPLVIVGTGSEENSLRKQSKSKNTIFVGQVSDDELVQYYRNCKAVIFPQEEDFGIVAVEAQSSGKPVIAYRAGGATETVVDRRTGVFFEKQTLEALRKVLENFDEKKFKPNDCIKNAKRFDKEIFKREFAKLVIL